MEISRLLFLTFVGLVAAGKPSAQVGDFAPLAVGNSWKYSGYSVSRNTRFGWFNEDSILKTASVQSSRKSDDTIFYEVLIRDSLFQRTGTYGRLNDTVVESTIAYRELDGVLASPLQERFFYKHQVPESLLTRPDTTGNRSPADFWVESLHGPFDFKGKNHFVYRRAYNWFLPGQGASDTLLYLQNFGLIFSKSGNGSTAGGGTSTLQLLEMNGIPIDNPPLGIAKRDGRPGPRSFRSQRILTGLFRFSRDLLGRLVAR